MSEWRKSSLTGEKGRTNVLYGIFFALVLVFLLFVHTRGLIYYDEGYILNSAKRLLLGEIPYRDFRFVYTPASIFITSLSFIAFGSNILSSRLMMLIFSFLASISLFIIANKITKSRYLSLLPTFLFVAFGPSVINFAGSLIYAIYFSVYTLLFLTLYLHSGRKSDLVLSGLFCGLTILSKQNIGLAVFLGGVYYSCRNLKKVKEFGYLALGTLIPVVLYGVYATATGSAFAFLYNMYDYSYWKFFREGILNTPLLHLDRSLFYVIGKSLLYLCPGIISVTALVKLPQCKKEYLFIPLVNLFIYILGIRPETDIIHLSPLIAVSGLSFLVLIQEAGHILLKQTKVLLFILLILVGFYNALFRNYYRWNTPLYRQKTFVAHPNIKLLVSDDIKNELLAIDKYLRRNTKEDKPIFVNYYSPLLYFVTDRRNATRFDYVSGSSLSFEEEEEIVSSLEAKKVDTIINHFLTEKTFLIDAYILANYQKGPQIGNFFIYERKFR